MHNSDDAEVWRDVAIAPIYQVSNYGQVRSLGRWERGYALKTQFLNDKGYPSVTIWTGGRRSLRPVHVLVATAFLDRTPEQLEVRHLDGVKTNNHVSNLAWGTKAQNTLDSVGHGRHNNARKTQCPRGHDYDWVYIKPSGQKVRGCTQCRTAANRARPSKAKGAQR